MKVIDFSTGLPLVARIEVSFNEELDAASALTQDGLLQVWRHRSARAIAKRIVELEGRLQGMPARDRGALQGELRMSRQTQAALVQHLSRKLELVPAATPR